MHGAARVGCRGPFLTAILAQSMCMWVASRGYEKTTYVNPNNTADVPYRLMEKHGAKMGVLNPGCDNAQYHLDVDYGGSPKEYTCTMKDFLWYKTVRGWYHSIYKCNKVRKGYRPYHYCMNKRITYSDAVPTHEGHRPLWPVYGEYKYVPPQRWLHNIEHGAVVMLYHPCAPRWFVEKLRKLVRGCLRKHIITPYRQLTLQRPLALVAWRCKLKMSHVNTREVIKFIKEHALRGPEGHLSMEGQYRYMLLAKARPPSGSNMDDANLCPFAWDDLRE
ncbi:uncharacterized protein [Dermacentor andersoni]|uniref:uncharacterized protein isoform X1 n=2 Tax=Dermacentor andersoni TaxID=34620 RepID=UPI002155305B|nr:uncharacterized protein LOC126520954 isoform X1 [Dermacentor andersoni]